LTVDNGRLSMLSTQVLDADGMHPRNLPENYGALIVPVSGFAQVGFDVGVYSLIHFSH
jgi:hypothetical protein